MKLDNWLEQRARTTSDRVALVADGASLTFVELEAEAAKAARRMAASGVRRDAVVALDMSPGPEKVFAIHGLVKLGAVLLPLDPGFSAGEREAAIAESGASVDLGDPRSLGTSEADLPLLGENDMESLHCRLMTGGSSGRVRSIGLTYGNHLFSAVGSAFNLGVDPEDRWLCSLPMNHISGLAIVMRSVIQGTGMVLHDEFDTGRVAHALESEGVSVVSLVSTMLSRLLDASVDLSGTRAILVGGGPVPKETLARALEAGAPVVQTYGMTETCSQVATLSVADARRKLGSAGRPLLTSHIRISEGEILVQGPTVSPEAIGSDGWLHTGDLGRIDEEGFLFVEGRSDRVIITGGENVIPEEVERVLLDHDSVADAEVFGEEDEEWQEIVVARVVPVGDEPVSPGDLVDHCAGRLARFKVPKRIEVVDRLERTAAGKLRGSGGDRAARTSSGP